MTPRRLETRIGATQPVRFYKIVALSFLVITIILLGMIVFMSSKRATITITTKENPVDVNFSVGVGEIEANQKVGGTLTTTTISLSQVFSPSGDGEVPGVATGIITIYNESGTDQPLIATTRFLSPDNVLFRLKSGTVVPAGGTVDAEVYADEEGASGNVEPSEFTIPGLNETRQKEVYGKSSQAMSGGVRTIGVVSQSDVDTAVSTLLEQAKTEGEKKLSSLQGDLFGIYKVTDYDYSTEVEIGEEVSGFTVSLSAVALGVFYDPEEIKELAVESLMNHMVDDTETIKAGKELPTVTIENFKDNGVILSVFYDGLVSLNSESEQLERNMFFGKTRDEIRRYVLSLDHVHSVDIKFSPAWMQTVPHVNEHVNVVVKNVR